MLKVLFFVPRSAVSVSAVRKNFGHPVSRPRDIDNKKEQSLRGGMSMILRSLLRSDDLDDVTLLKKLI